MVDARRQCTLLEDVHKVACGSRCVKLIRVMSSGYKANFLIPARSLL